MVQRVLVAQPRGFCAGVEMAIKALSFLVDAFESPVYCYHEIVHNRIVVDRFKKRGVIFLDSIDEVPENAVVMLSAHGSAPDVVDRSQEHGRISVNAVCPLVTKVHHEAKTRTKKGFEIIYVGHEGHDEALGTMAVAPDKIHLVIDEKSLQEVSEEIGDNTVVALLAQTTLAMSEWSSIASKAKELYPDLWTASKSDLCFATTNRQSALKALAEQSTVLLIIGSSNSSNTLALEKVAKEHGCQRVYRIETAKNLEAIEFLESDVVGITAGASAPEDIVQEVIDSCKSIAPPNYVSVIDEDEYFPPPSQLRNLVIDLNFAVDEIINHKRPRNSDSRNFTQEQSSLKSVFAQDRNLQATNVLT